jgi:hypothetical protein
VQDPRGVRADLDARADLAQRPRALVDVDVEARLQQGQRGREAADAASDHADRDLLAFDAGDYEPGSVSTPWCHNGA